MRPAAALYIMYIELLPGLRLNQMAHRSQWSHSYSEVTVFFVSFSRYTVLKGKPLGSNCK